MYVNAHTNNCVKTEIQFIKQSIISYKFIMLNNEHK